MKSWSVLGTCSFVLLAACNVSLNDPNAVDPSAATGDDDTTAIAGANQNDRSLAKDGDDLQTGAMVASPSGRHLVMQRNTETLVYDVATSTYHSLPAPFLRVAFAKDAEVAFAFVAAGSSGPVLQAVNLDSLQVLWTLSLPTATAGCTMLRTSDDTDAILVADAAGVHVVDAHQGTLRSTTPTPSAVTYAAFVPGQARALVAGQTTWEDKTPHTPVYDLDLKGSAAAPTPIDVPNCEAPIAVTPDGQRAFLSPTYCTPGAAKPAGEVWTNPDPVSVIDLATTGATFRKNLPGFGPVVMAKDGSRLVAYLDVQRMDPAMFEDASQVPWKDGPRYSLMTIDPATLKFELTAIGNAIPRFAMTSNGRGLLVDASAQVSSRVKIAARASFSIGPDGIDGNAETNVDIFGAGSATFGYFDLDAQKFTSFSGPFAPLDRFVQFADGHHVLTLGKRADGLGGIPYLIDVQAHTTLQLGGFQGSGVRDVGLSADGATAYLRLRMPAAIHDGGFYSREAFCASSTGECDAGLTATFEAAAPFAVVPPPPAPPPVVDNQPPPAYTPAPPPDECPDNHDCY